MKSMRNVNIWTRKVRADGSPFTRPSFAARKKKRRHIEKLRRKARSDQR